MNQCGSCGGDLDPGEASCPFCGASLAALGEDNAARVPLEHQLGNELRAGKTFDDSQREISRALGHAERAEQARNSAFRKLVYGLFAAAAILIPYGLYTVIFKLGYVEGALNTGVFRATEHEYGKAESEFKYAARSQPSSPEPLYLQGALLYLRLTRSPEIRDQLYREARLREAKFFLDRALERRAAYPPAEFYLGLIAWGGKHREEAAFHWQRCVDQLSAKPAPTGLETRLLAAARKGLQDSRGSTVSLDGVPPELGGTAKTGADGVPFGRYP